MSLLQILLQLAGLVSDAGCRKQCFLYLKEKCLDVSDWSHLCVSSVMKEESHIVRVLFFCFLNNLCFIMVNMGMHSER